MNAARPIFAALAPAPQPPTPQIPAPAARRARRSKVAASPTPPEIPADAADDDEYSACLSQARICRDQAQEAARLKRFRAAGGLFQTAIALCQRAASLRKSPGSTEAAQAEAPHKAPPGDGGEAHEYLQVLANEMSAYDELVRSLNRPLRDSARS